MIYKGLFKFLKKLSIFLLIALFLNGCGAFERKDPIDPDARARARKNVEEGRGIGGVFKKGSGETTYQFATSNPLWRASLDTLDFMVLATVDYAGGLIISDWYSEDDPNEAIKITLRFLDNEVRVDALKVSIHKKTCQNSNCKVSKIESDLAFDIKDKIIKKAARLVKTDKQKKKSKRIKSAIINNEKGL